MEKINFEMSKKLLYDVIMRQAGSLQKAIMEGIQNAVDADDCNKIIISITKNFVGITDNGKGMNEKEVRSNFKTFGDSVKRNDNSKIGIFGMGRGQLFAMGKTTYQTLDNIMFVDIKENGLCFNLEKNKLIKGCKVSVELYEEKRLSDYDILRLVKNVKKLVYLPGKTIIINGEKIEYKEKVEIFESIRIVKSETSMSSKSSLFVKGMYIKNIYDSVNNYIILNDDLTLNFARNDIIVDKKYKKFMSELDKLNTRDLINYDRRKTYSDHSLIYNLLEKDMIKKDDIFTLKFIETSDSSFYSPKFLSENKVVDVSDQNYDDKSKISEYIRKYTEHVAVNLDGDQRNILRKIGIKYGLSKPFIMTNEALKELLNKIEKNIDKSKLTTRYSNLCNFTNNINISIAEELDIDERSITFVENAKFNAITDGNSLIRVNVDIFKGLTNHCGAHTIFMILLHEYAHDKDSSSNGHDNEFYIRFHDYSQKTRELYGELINDWSSLKNF